MSRVLIFDDDVDILELCALVLQSRGFETATENNCRNVIKRVKEVAPDVILMDNWIPDSGGIIASRTIKSNEAFQHIPIVYFSANNDIKSLAKEAGADAFLAKPFDLEELEKVIEGLMYEKPQADTV